MRPVPGIQTPRATAHPLFGLAPGGVCKDGTDHSGSRRALTPPFHPYRTCARRFVFCCTFLSGAYGPRHPFVQGTPCSMESGLSSSSKNRRLPADTSTIIYVLFPKSPMQIHFFRKLYAKKRSETAVPDRFSINPISGLLLRDGFRRAAGNTGSAINAGAFVNGCSSVLHGDCSDRTGPRACFTSNAFRCINFCRHNDPPFFQPLRMASARPVSYTMNSNPSSMEL